jgi:shikimate 5-dehydrogenase
MIDGRTKLIAHIDYPTESFKAPMIYNPYFEKCGINAVVVPMGCKADDYPPAVPAQQCHRRACDHAAQDRHDGAAG